MRRKLMLLPGLFTLFSCTGCDNEVNPGNEKPLVDITTVCRSVQEMGGYATFYKPQAGYVGDPMPYYNEADNLFYVFFLQDWRNGEPTDHPVYFTKTKERIKQLTQQVQISASAIRYSKRKILNALLQETKGYYR